MYDSEDDEDFVSKSELKREMQRYQELGETLCDLPHNRWPDLPISDTLRAALEESRRIGKHEARRRHFQYVGKLMRDEDIDALPAKPMAAVPVSLNSGVPGWLKMPMPCRCFSMNTRMLTVSSCAIWCATPRKR